MKKSNTRKIKPKNFHELRCALALSRPGCIAFLEQYCDFINNGIIKSIHPLIKENILEEGVRLIWGIFIYSGYFRKYKRYRIFFKKSKQRKIW